MALELAFAALWNQVRPKPAEVERARSRAGGIRSRLQKTFRLRGVRFIGSHARETAVRSISDLDLLAIFARDDARWGGNWKSSYTFTDAIRDDLLGRYPSTEIGRRGQAVVVNFGDQSVDVVPAVYFGPGPNNYPLYLIPNGDGEWMQTGPEIHGKFINDEHERSRGKLKRVIQVLKFWRACRVPHIPMSSFHLELLLASEGTCVGVKSYWQCLFDSLYLIANRQGRGLRDPLGTRCRRSS
jgi:hypothetical protein